MNAAIFPKKGFSKKRTVLVNKCFLGSQKMHCSETFAVAHEGCHVIKDKRYFEEHADEVASICKANDSKRVYWKGTEPTLELIERQNDFLTAAVIMPKEQIKNEFFRILRWKNVPSQPIKFEDYMKQGIGVLTKRYDIGFNVVKYRLQDIGVLVDPRLGVFND